MKIHHKIIAISVFLLGLLLSHAKTVSAYECLLNIAGTETHTNLANGNGRQLNVGDYYFQVVHDSNYRYVNRGIFTFHPNEGDSQEQVHENITSSQFNSNGNLINPSTDNIWQVHIGSNMKKVDLKIQNGEGTNDCSWHFTVSNDYEEHFEFSLCGQLADDDMITECHRCESEAGYWSALGCVSTDKSTLTSNLITIGIGLGGGITLVSILYGAFIYSTSSGNPEKTKQGKDLITAAITGLIFTILAVVIYRFVGIELLGIPGLG